MISAKILVVDDSTTDRLIIRNMLEGYQVLSASGGMEAIQEIEAHPDINLIILDLNMPGMDGFEVLKILKSNEQYQKIRVIILTNYDELDNEIKGLREGAIDYIRKPAQIDSLRARIEIHLELIRIQQTLEEQLSEQGLTFDLIFTQAPIGISISHNNEPSATDDGHVKINSFYEQITGRSREEHVRLGWAQITHPDDLEEDLELFRKLKAGLISNYTIEKRLIRPDGSIIWIHMVVVAINPYFESQYKPLCLVQDITKRKTAEMKLMESERSKSVLLSHIPGIAFRRQFDRDGTMLYISDGCYSLTGYKPDSFINNRELAFNNIITLECRDWIWHEWERTIPSRLPYKCEYEITTASGKPIWVLEMGQGIPNQQGDIAFLEGIILNITYRKEMENNLRYINEHDKLTGLYNRDYLEKLLIQDTKNLSFVK